MQPYSLQIQSVLYHNKKESLYRALDSLANAIKLAGSNRIHGVTVSYGDASKEPIFSSEEIASMQAAYAPQFALQYRFFNENTGTSRGHNLLGANCQTEYMMIMNPDVVVSPKIFEKMILPFETPNAQAGMTEARQTPIEHPKDYNKLTLETDWASTACAMFPTELFRQIKGFDEQSFFMYGDDLDFSWRIRLAGKKIYYRADCPVYHAKSLSAKGGWVATGAEILYSAQAALLLAYKYSADQRLKTLYNAYSSSEDRALKQAAEHFDQLRKSNMLPERLDPDHRVSRFVGDYYTEHRFVL